MVSRTSPSWRCRCLPAAVAGLFGLSLAAADNRAPADGADPSNANRSGNRQIDGGAQPAGGTESPAPPPRTQRHASTGSPSALPLDPDPPPTTPAGPAKALPRVQLPLINKLLGAPPAELLARREPHSFDADPATVLKWLDAFAVADLRQQQPEHHWRCRWWISDALGADLVGYDQSNGHMTRIALYFRRFDAQRAASVVRLLRGIERARFDERAPRISVSGRVQDLPVNIVLCRQVARGTPPAALVGGAALVEFEIDPVAWRLAHAPDLDDELLQALSQRRIIIGMAREDVEAILGRVHRSVQNPQPAEQLVTYYRADWPYDRRAAWRVRYVGGRVLGCDSEP